MISAQNTNPLEARLTDRQTCAMKYDLWRELALSSPPITPLTLRTVSGKSCALAVLRLDLIHPQLSGNKVFKLLPNMTYAREQGIGHLISFGGAHSNHIHALAWAGQETGFKTTGIIRCTAIDTATLEDAQRWGMQLIPVGYAQYRRRYDADYLADLGEQFPNSLIIPEGGANGRAVGEFAQVFRFVDATAYRGCISACGTGTTLAGLINAMPHDWQAWGVSVLKAPWMAKQVTSWLSEGLQRDWQLVNDAHLGGYGQAPADYLSWLADFETLYGLPLDPVYTGKVMYALWQEKIPPVEGLPYLFIHTGGLQGKRGFSASSK